VELREKGLSKMCPEGNQRTIFETTAGVEEPAELVSIEIRLVVTNATIDFDNVSIGPV
jgi:hypothetical protein